MLNFFQSTIKVDILILGNADIQVRNNGRVIYEGSKEDCFDQLRRDMFNLQGLSGRTVKIELMALASASNPKLVADAKTYFKSKLGMLKSATKVNLVVPSILKVVPAIVGAGFQR